MCAPDLGCPSPPRGNEKKDNDESDRDHRRDDAYVGCREGDQRRHERAEVGEEQEDGDYDCRHQADQVEHGDSSVPLPPPIAGWFRGQKGSMKSPPCQGSQNISRL